MKPWLPDWFSRRGRGHVAADMAARYQGGVRSITDAPLPRTSRWLMTLMLGALATAVLWAALGSMKVVAFAQGHTVVSSRVQPVQSVTRARVTRVLATDGARVEAGEPVMHLERASASASVDELSRRLLRSRAARARLKALLASDEDELPEFEAPDGLPADMARAERVRMQNQWQTYQLELDELQQEERNRIAALETSQATLEALDAVIPYLDRRVGRLRRLVRSEAVAVHQLDDAERELIAKESERKVEAQRLNEVRGRALLATGRILATRARFRSERLEELAREDDRVGQLRQDLVEARSRLKRHTLRAPVAGIVQDLRVRMSGTVVEPAQILMRIVPEGRPVEVEATILNSDIGFAEEGQAVDVKFDAYDFTRYGAVPGIIRDISRTSSEHEELGRIYKAVIELDRSTIIVDGRNVRLRPGMTTTVDIDMGSRRIISYFLGPIMRYKDEALRER